ncbi:divergent polysaccharide deacetylase family protein [Nitratireductor basaltis]|uniref:Divergent polysaccharide deacetylase family protein n=1 Tax=Nitratireductor basaltis TaxID=472175 RepID=A0A084U6T0_9HYPH|nr:divergent polysaccharide deacetylase family protein [Nitratireductor basaltis]KFB08666.1 hypothetical protein EL18_02920 [Nitratireductor basaltis]
MKSSQNRLDTPLGQTPEPRQTRTARRVGLASFLYGSLAVAVVAGSTVLALRDKGYDGTGNGQMVQAAAPDAMATDGSATLDDAKPVAAAAREAPSNVEGKPQIIKVPKPVPENDSFKRIVIRDPSSVGPDSRVAHLPDRALLEESESGVLPVRDANGRRPFDAYARPWSGAGGAKIAIVIGGLGISQTGTQAAIQALPGEVTLAFAPHGNSLGRWMQEARRDGHEILLQVPLEPFDYPRANPGRHTLLVSASETQRQDDLHWVLARMTNYVGVMNYMGARFTADQAAMEELMDELAQRGLGYLDDGSSARSLARDVAQRKGVPFAASDAAIDASGKRGDILAKLDELERTARAKGMAIGYGSALEATVETVSAWAGEVRKRGIELVPVTAVSFDPER